MKNYKIRKAKTDDLRIINDIYNQAVVKKYQTADIELITMVSRKLWFINHNVEKYPIFVLENNNKIVGWVSLSSYRTGRKALETTAEVSYYVHNDYQNRGIGTVLLKSAIDISAEYNFKNLIAILLESNIRSIKLLEKFNFKSWGTLPKIAKIDGKYYDHLYYGLKLVTNQCYI